MGVQTMDGTTAALLDAARALVPLIGACADETERERQLPQPLVDALAAAGLLRMTVPREYGGGECDPETLVRVTELVSAADGSAGWCVAVATQNGMSAGYLPAEGARAIFGTPPDNVALVILPAGRARAVAGGYRLTGRWSFASGCRHATWLGGGAVVYEGDAPRLGPDGQPETRYLFFPAREGRILDTWHVTGLRGTGSHDIAAEDVFVPAERTRVGTYSAQEAPGRLYAFAVGVMPITAAAVGLGIARGALDALARLAANKVPRAGGGLLLRDQPVAQYRLGVAEAQLRGARALLLDLTREVWAAVGPGRLSTDEERALLGWASAHAAAMAARAVDTAWELAGGSAVFAGSAFERRFRDVHMVTQQFIINAARYADGGRVFLAPTPDG